MEISKIRFGGPRATKVASSVQDVRTDRPIDDECGLTDLTSKLISLYRLPFVCHLHHEDSMFSS